MKEKIQTICLVIIAISVVAFVGDRFYKQYKVKSFIKDTFQTEEKEKKYDECDKQCDDCLSVKDCEKCYDECYAKTYKSFGLDIPSNGR